MVRWLDGLRDVNHQTIKKVLEFVLNKVYYRTNVIFLVSKISPSTKSVYNNTPDKYD